MSVVHPTARRSGRKPHRRVERTCLQCGKVFLGRSDARFCGRPCYDKARPKEVRAKRSLLPPRLCLRCGTGFVPGDSRRVYCSRACSNAEKERRGPAPTLRQCRVCGAHFLGFKASGDLCSEACRQKARLRACSWCGRMFVGAQEKSHLCSSQCQSRYHDARQERKSGEVECRGCGKRVRFEKGFSSLRAYCSAACAKKTRRKHGKYQRKVRIKSQPSEVVTVAFLIQRDKGMCRLCGKAVDRKASVPHVESPTIDHVIPLAKGGAHTKANTQLVHYGCNMSKSDRLEMLF
jgi:5-methylcytosine-specific restriction endonuclease McrA